MFQSSLATTFRSLGKKSFSLYFSWALVTLPVPLSGCNEPPNASTENRTRSSVTRQVLQLQHNPSDQAGPSPISENSKKPQKSKDIDVPEAEGPPRMVEGVVHARTSKQPEVGCRVTYEGHQRYTDSNGVFRFERLPSGGTIKLRFSCRGHIERQTHIIPSGQGAYIIDEPFVIGPRKTTRTHANQRGHTTSLNEALHQMRSERADNAEEDSAFLKAMRGLANFSGIAAAVGTAGNDDGKRYRVLGQWKRAERHVTSKEEPTPGSPKRPSTPPTKTNKQSTAPDAVQSVLDALQQRSAKNNGSPPADTALQDSERLEPRPFSYIPMPSE